jgi:hypothetical protein
VSDHADGWRADTRTSSDTVAVRYADQLRHAFAQAPGEHDGVWWLRWDASSLVPIELPSCLATDHTGATKQPHHDPHYQRRALTSREITKTAGVLGAMARRWHAGPRAHPYRCDRPGVGPGLACGFLGGAPRRNRTGDPILTIDARELRNAMRDLP